MVNFNNYKAILFTFLEYEVDLTKINYYDM